MTKKKYTSPIISQVNLDNEISMIGMSYDSGDKPHHKPGCHCRHCNPDKHKPHRDSNPFGGNSPFE